MLMTTSDEMFIYGNMVMLLAFVLAATCEITENGSLVQANVKKYMASQKMMFFTGIFLPVGVALLAFSMQPNALLVLTIWAVPFICLWIFGTKKLSDSTVLAGDVRAAIREIYSQMGKIADIDKMTSPEWFTGIVFGIYAISLACWWVVRLFS